jgi:hypothetical protein
MMGAVARIPGVRVNLGGEEYVIPPLSLSALEQLEERLATFEGDLRDKEQRETLVVVLHAAIARNYPHVTLGHLRDVLDIGNSMDAFGACMDVSGLRRKAQENEAVESGKSTSGSTGEA